MTEQNAGSLKRPLKQGLILVDVNGLQWEVLNDFGDSVPVSAGPGNNDPECYSIESDGLVEYTVKVG